MIRKKITKSLLLLLSLLFTIGSALLYVILRFKKINFDSVNADELLFLLFSPTTGGNVENFRQDIVDGIFPLVFALTFMIVPIIIGYFLYSKPSKKSEGIEPIIQRSVISYMFLYSFSLFMLSATYTAQQLQIPSYIVNQFTTTELYEKHYNDPEKAKFSIPATKRNLIVIYMESMENTLASQANGGAHKVSKIPELEKLALDPTNVSFSHTERLGGARPVFATTWTAAALTSMTLGVPLVPTADIDDNEFGKLPKFLPGAYSIGEILKELDYNQSVMFGSEASFGGRDNLYKQHGNFDVYDLLTARESGFIPEDYKVWWGFEDEKLFTYAQNVLTKLVSDDKPFHFQLLTADTHFSDGYLDSTCSTPYDKQYDNVYACSSARVARFLDWLRLQPYFDNTTVVLIGDHLGMQTDYYENVMPAGYERTIYNAFINSAKEPLNSKNRTFTSLDLYPTILSSIGITSKQNRLGLGTDLFSDRQTLAEELGIGTFNQELSRRSSFYSNKIMNGN